MIQVGDEIPDVEVTMLGPDGSPAETSCSLHQFLFLAVVRTCIFLVTLKTHKNWLAEGYQESPAQLFATLGSWTLSTKHTVLPTS